MTVATLFEEQCQYLNTFFSTLDRERADAFVQECLNTKGLLILTGVGKSGIVAEKIAMTLISTGTRALYLPPMNFLHGDIGILTNEDTVIALSKSGETEELLDLIPFIRKRGAKLLTCVSNEESRLAKFADLSITLPVEKELCPFDLAPTTSTVVQLIFGDVLAVALMEAKEFSLEEYAENHPSGSIGKKILLTVDDLMLKGEDIPMALPEARLIDELVQLSNKKCGALLIADSDRNLLGIFTDGDLRRALQREGVDVMQTTLVTLMTTKPITLSPSLSAWEAKKMLQKDPKRWVMVAPVVQEGKAVGILRMHDVVHAGI